MIFSTVALALSAVASPVTFESVKLDLNVGDKFTYKSSSEMSSDMMSSSTKETRVVEVVSEDDGWYRLKVSTTEHEQDIDSPGPAMGSQKGMVVSYRVSPTRKMKGWKMDDVGGLSEMSSESMGEGAKSQESNGFQSLVLPDGDLKVGTKWTQKRMPAPMRFGQGGVDTESEGGVEVSYEAVEFTGSGANRVVVIESKAKGEIITHASTDQGEFTIETTVTEESKYWVRVSDGVLIKMETESERSMSTDFGEFTMESKNKTELVKS